MKTDTFQYSYTLLETCQNRLCPQIILPGRGGHGPWLPKFVPKIGLEIVMNGFLSFLRANATEHGNDPTQGGSLIIV